jgi:hypothetical protein
MLSEYDTDQLRLNKAGLLSGSGAHEITYLIDTGVISPSAERQKFESAPSQTKVRKK